MSYRPAITIPASSIEAGDTIVETNARLGHEYRIVVSYAAVEGPMVTVEGEGSFLHNLHNNCATPRLRAYGLGEMVKVIR